MTTPGSLETTNLNGQAPAPSPQVTPAPATTPDPEVQFLSKAELDAIVSGDSVAPVSENPASKPAEPPAVTPGVSGEPAVPAPAPVDPKRAEAEQTLENFMRLPEHVQQKVIGYITQEVQGTVNPTPQNPQQDSTGISDIAFLKDMPSTALSELEQVIGEEPTEEGKVLAATIRKMDSSYQQVIKSLVSKVQALESQVAPVAAQSANNADVARLAAMGYSVTHEEVARLRSMGVPDVVQTYITVKGSPVAASAPAAKPPIPPGMGDTSVDKRRFVNADDPKMETVDVVKAMLAGVPVKSGLDLPNLKS